MGNGSKLYKEVSKLMNGNQKAKVNARAFEG